MQLTRRPRENDSCRAIDPLFGCAAVTHRSWFIGVVLSELLDGDAAGLSDIKRRGGIAVVQAPADAFTPKMPHNAIKATAVDYCARIRSIGALLNWLARAPVPRTALGAKRHQLRDADYRPFHAHRGRHGAARPICFPDLFQVRRPVVGNAREETEALALQDRPSLYCSAPVDGAIRTYRTRATGGIARHVRLGKCAQSARAHVHGKPSPQRGRRTRDANRGLVNPHGRAETYAVKH